MHNDLVSRAEDPGSGRRAAWGVGCAFGAGLCTVAAWVVEVIALMVTVFGGHGPLWSLLLILLFALVILVATPALFSYLFYRLYRRHVPEVQPVSSLGPADSAGWPYRR